LAGALSLTMSSGMGLRPIPAEADGLEGIVSVHEQDAVFFRYPGTAGHNLQGAGVPADGLAVVIEPHLIDAAARVLDGDLDADGVGAEFRSG